MAAGVVPTELLYAELVEMLRWWKGRRGLLDRLAGPPITVEPVHVKTTSGTADGDGNYPGVVTLWSASDAAWQEYATAVKLRPPNGETLANNTRYPARPAGRTAGGDELYVMLSGTGVTGGSITVEESDGSPSYANISTVRFPAAGANVLAVGSVVLTNPSAGVALVSLYVQFATSSNGAGVLNDAVNPQTIPGNKVWTGTASFSSTANFSGDVGFTGAIDVDGATQIDWPPKSNLPSSSASTIAFPGAFILHDDHLYYRMSSGEWRRIASNTF